MDILKLDLPPMTDPAVECVYDVVSMPPVASDGESSEVLTARHIVAALHACGYMSIIDGVVALRGPAPGAAFPDWHPSEVELADADRDIDHAARYRQLQPLTDEDLDKIADGMPGGLDGFMKGWGWRQYARAVLAFSKSTEDPDAE